VTMLAALLVCVAASAHDLSFDMVEAQKRPVTKIVDLLNGMKDQMEKEGEEDQEMYENYKCWCQTNGDEKVEAAQVLAWRSESRT
ncbi:unnamed protein product, partial [Polarella glacialis]